MGTVVKRPDCAGRYVDWPRCAGLFLVRVERGLHVIPHVRCLTNSRFDLNLNVFMHSFASAVGMILFIGCFSSLLADRIDAHGIMLLVDRPMEQATHS
jgi:hypothetical protein